MFLLISLVLPVCNILNEEQKMVPFPPLCVDREKAKKKENGSPFYSLLSLVFVLNLTVYVCE